MCKPAWYKFVTVKANVLLLWQLQSLKLHSVVVNLLYVSKNVVRKFSLAFMYHTHWFHFHFEEEPEGFLCCLVIHTHIKIDDFSFDGQVGSKFGGSTLKLGSILTDGQVGIFKDRSTAAMSTFGDILPAQAAGLLSSFTASKSDSWLHHELFNPKSVPRWIREVLKLLIELRRLCH